MIHSEEAAVREETTIRETGGGHSLASAQTWLRETLPRLRSAGHELRRIHVNAELHEAGLFGEFDGLPIVGPHAFDPGFDMAVIGVVRG